MQEGFVSCLLLAYAFVPEKCSMDRKKSTGFRLNPEASAAVDLEQVMNEFTNFGWLPGSNVEQ